MTSSAEASTVIAFVAVSGSSRGSTHVVIAGGGFAALEAVLALSALAGGRAPVTLISPDPWFAYRPAATIEAFDDAPPRAYDLRAIADDLGAVYRVDRLEAVAPRTKYVRLASGARLEYDALVLAVGARARGSIAGALTFRDQRDVPRFRLVLRALEAGAVGRLVFAVPAGCSWPLPLYELALLSSTHASEHHVEAEVALVSPEQTPLAVFGAEASRLVADLLAQRGVLFVGGSVASGVRRDGWLELRSDAAIEADRVVAAPQLHAKAVPGVPAGWLGFVPTDSYGRVEGLADVYAAGDMTTVRIKQGGLAAQQADRIAYTIAAGLGVPVDESRATRVLRARLLGGERPLSLHVERYAQGQPAAASLQSDEPDHASSSTKVFGRYLTPYLEAREPHAGSPATGG